MKKIIIALVVFASVYNLAFASAIYERKVQPSRSAIMYSTSSPTAVKTVQDISSVQSLIDELYLKVEEDQNNLDLRLELINLLIENKRYSDVCNQMNYLLQLYDQNILNEEHLSQLKEMKLFFEKSVRYDREKFYSQLILAYLNYFDNDYEASVQNITVASKNAKNANIFNRSLDIFAINGKEEGYRTALSILDNIIDNSSKGYEYRPCKIRFLEALGNVGQSFKEMSLYIENAPDDIPSKYDFYRMLADKNYSDKKLIKLLYPNQDVTYETFYEFIAKKSFEFDDLNTAFDYAQKLIDNYPENPNGYLLLAQIYKNHDQSTEAYEMLKAVRDKLQNQEQIEQYNVLLAEFSDQPVKEADALINSGLYSQAMEVLKTANQEELSVLLGLSKASYLAKNKQACFEYLNKAMSLYPDNIDVLNYFAFIFYQEGDIQSSRNYINRVLELNPDNSYALQLLDNLNRLESSAYINQIISAFDSQNYSEALRVINLALDIDKNNSILYYYQGLTYIAMNNYAMATAPLYKAIELDNKNVIAYFYLALSLDNLSEQQSALEYYQKFVKLLPVDNYAESEKLNYAKTRIQKLIK